MKPYPTLLLGSFFLLLSLKANCQDLVTETLLANAPEWHEGMVTLTDGREISGMIKFDDNVGVVAFQQGDISKTLTAERCGRFEFFDDESNLLRTFYSLEYEDRKNPKKFYFFEVLKAFKNFAVLSKVDPLDVQERAHSTGGAVTPDGKVSPGMLYTTTAVQQIETIYFMNREGGIDPYLQIIEKEGTNLIGKRSKNRYVDPALLERYTGKHYPQLEAFAIQHGLTFKRKGDLLEVLDLYLELLGE